MITAEQIHNELWDLGLNRLADLKSTVVDNKAIETKRNLESLGFTQSETFSIKDLTELYLFLQMIL